MSRQTDFLKWVHNSNAPTLELRILTDQCVFVLPDGKKCLTVYGGVFNDLDKLMEWAKEFSGGALSATEFTKKPHVLGCYYGINPPNLTKEIPVSWTDYKTKQQISDILKVTVNNRADKIKSRSGIFRAVSDPLIAKRTVILIDIDSFHPVGMGATSEEKEAAEQVAVGVSEFLKEQSFPCHAIVDSGNGYHIYIPVDLPNDPASLNLVERFLAVMSEKFSCTTAQIDCSVGNASRIARLPDTKAAKGPDDPTQRPWREARIIHLPKQRENYTIEQLEVIAKQAPAGYVNSEPRGTATDYQIELAVEKLTDFCEEYDIQVTTPVHKHDGVYMFCKCPWEDQHRMPGNGSDVCIRVDNGGAFNFICKHSHGHDLHWANFREHYDPDRDFVFVPAITEGELEEASQRWGMDLEEPSAPVAKYAGPPILVTKKQLPASLTLPQGVGPAPIIHVNTTPVGRPFEFNDVGNSERLAYRYAAKFRYCPQRDWHKWTGTRWKEDALNDIVNAAIDTLRNIPAIELAAYKLGMDDEHEAEAASNLDKWAQRSLSKKSIDSMVGLAKSAPGFATHIKSFDRDLWLFNAANGTIDLKTGAFKLHDPADLITKISPVAYDPTARCPQWLSFLNDIMMGDQGMVDFLQRAAGYSMTGSTSEEVLFLLYGTGQNGKTKLIETLRYVMGDYQCQAQMDMFLEKHFGDGIPNDIARLEKVRLVTASESNADKVLAEAKIKMLTGGDTVSARFLRQEFFDFTPTHKIWLATNHQPTIRGTDKGIWRRLCTIPFDWECPEPKKDPLLLEKLKTEASGILNWMLAGLKEWRRVGLKPPQRVQEASDQYREDQDWMGKFFNDCVEFVPPSGVDVQSSILYGQYQLWARRNGFKQPATATKFGLLMKGRGYKSVKKRDGQFYENMKLKIMPSTWLPRAAEPDLDDVEQL
jgi:P4 family phage/plasmid primase-like protien